MPFPAYMVFILFVQVLKKVLKSLKFELKNPAETLIKVIANMVRCMEIENRATDNKNK